MNNILLRKFTYRIGSALGLFPYLPGSVEIEESDSYKKLYEYLYKFYNEVINDYFDENR